MTDTPNRDSDCYIRTEVSGARASIVLNRPQAINALTVDMIAQITERLAAWATDDAVEQVEISGEGERGFCAGADVRWMRSAIVDGFVVKAEAFLLAEYELNALIAGYPKPMTARLHGISMGGGLGLALHCRTRVATSDLRLAMPEVGIGIWPDVGVAYELSRMPRRTGWLLALSGNPIDAASASWAGLVDRVEGAGSAVAQLSFDADWIEECLTADTVLDAVGALAEHPHPRARAAAEAIASRSALAVAVAWEHMVRASKAGSVADVLANDVRLATRFLAESEFVEGVRAQLVDKDRRPRWRFGSLGEVDCDAVARLFE